MSARKLAISLDGDLAKEVQRAAKVESRGNVSAWLAEAAPQRLRQLAAKQALKVYEDEMGEITEAELRRVRRLGRGADPRQRRAHRRREGGPAVLGALEGGPSSRVTLTVPAAVVAQVCEDTRGRPRPSRLRGRGSYRGAGEAVAGCSGRAGPPTSSTRPSRRAAARRDAIVTSDRRDIERLVAA